MPPGLRPPCLCSQLPRRLPPGMVPWHLTRAHESMVLARTKICSSDKCKIIFRTSSKECGAVAIAETGTGWGGGKRTNRAAAELGAMQSCQKHTKGQCKIRSVECNRYPPKSRVIAS